MFDMISLGGDSEISHRVFWSISAAMEFNKRLTKLDLEYMEMTRQQAAALGAGLVTFNSQNFKELRMTKLTFADGAITELASGLKLNSTLCILTVGWCCLEDAELVELIDAVESHPSLKELSMWGNNGQKHALVALGKVLASKSCQLEVLDFSRQGPDYNIAGLTGHLGILAQGFLQGNKSLTHLDLSESGLVDKDMDHLGQILATCKLEKLDLSENKITHSGFVSLTQNIPKSLKSLDLSENCFGREEAACHTLTLFKEHPQLWSCNTGFHCSKSPIERNIQHFKDRCGRILLAGDGGARISLSVWPIVLARVNRVLAFDSDERIHNAIFHLLQGLALVQRRFDRDSSQATCVGAGAGERLPTSSKRGPAETTDQASAKKGRSE
jgi:Ran GTPase-activating protein (RanGAP) involved in mRNA processing and transport